MTDTCTLERQIQELRLHLDSAESEVKSLKSGRKASSARVRKSLQNIKVGSHSMRKSVMEYTKSLPTKTRAKKVVEKAVEKAENLPVIEPVIEKEEEMPPSPPKLVRTKRVQKPKTPPPTKKK